MTAKAIEGEAVELYLMSPPGLDWALRGRANFRSRTAPAVDARAAIAEWLSLADAIEARGGRVACLMPPPGAALTGLPYAAECGHALVQRGEAIFLLPNMAVEHRRGERALWARAAEAMGLRPVEVEGVWEAQGDVASFRGRPMLFFGGRTDAAGVEGVRGYFDDPLVLEVCGPAFHGNMAVLPLEAAGRLLACRSVLTPSSWRALTSAFGEAVEEVSEDDVRRYATNGLPVGPDWLVPHLVPAAVRERVASWGVGVFTLPMVELCEKAGGASRCLVSHARLPAAALRSPAEYDFRVRRAEIEALAH